MPARYRPGVSINRPRGFEEYVGEVERFYSVLSSHSDLFQRLSERGVTAEDISQAQADLAELKELNRIQDREMSEAQQATRKRSDTRRAFADWLAEYQKFARLALADQPDLLEQLGLTVRSN